MDLEIIVRYVGDISFLEEQYGATIVYLLGNYAIVTIANIAIEELAAYKEIIYVERPNNIYLQVNQAKQASCISNAKQNTLEVSMAQTSGAGVLVAIIDSGIDYAHPDFCTAENKTRIVSIWDQDAEQQNTLLPAFGEQEFEEQTRRNRGGDIPDFDWAAYYNRGYIYSSAQINRALQEFNRGKRLQLVPQIDSSGHGTFVAGIAAGNGRASGGRYQGVAYEADIIVVKLGKSNPMGFVRTTELMMAIDYVIRMAMSRRQPIAINISYGNNYGAHNGQSILETYMDTALEFARGALVVGMGNEGDAGKHAVSRLPKNEWVSIPFSIGVGQQNFEIQLWSNAVDEMEIILQAPDGTVVGTVQRDRRLERYTYRDTEVRIYYSDSTPYQALVGVVFEFVRMQEAQVTLTDVGEWNIALRSSRELDTPVSLWMPVSEVTKEDTRFLTSSLEGTLTIPATAKTAIAVGAYDSLTDRVASFSGRGKVEMRSQIGGANKPDLVAPGVRVTSCAPGGGYTVKSGTSVATPFVTGGAACILQYGIVAGNDPSLYGEKLRVYLQKKARPLPGFEDFPSNQIGYGAFCLE